MQWKKAAGVREVLVELVNCCRSKLVVVIPDDLDMSILCFQVFYHEVDLTVCGDGVFLAPLLCIPMAVLHPQLFSSTSLVPDPPISTSYSPTPDVFLITF